MHRYNSSVSTLIREVSERIVLPRFRSLHSHEVFEKSPGEVVTIADREAEAALAEGLYAVDGDVRIIGEEACSADPALLTGIDKGRCWIIDPIDGTSNFAAGIEPFGIMIALLEDGEAKASWLYDPVSGRMCHARFGGGAFVNQKPVLSRSSGAERPIISLASQFMTEDSRTVLHARAEQTFDVVPIPRCAAEHYPRICFGQNDIAMFQRTLPWDHVPGALFLNEAGGRVARWNGSTYRVGDQGSGILAAASQALWDEGAKILFE